MSGRRVLVLARRIVSGFRRDHRSLALLFVVPVVVTALLGWIVTVDEAGPPRILVAVEDPLLAAPVETALQGAPTDAIQFVGRVDAEAAGRQRLIDEQADAMLVVPPGTAAAIAAGGAPELRIVTLGLNPVADAGIVPRLGTVLAAAFAGPGAPPAPTLVHEAVYGAPNADQLDALGPIFIGYFAYFFVFILTGISFLRERIGGTLERLLATPVRRGEIILGYSIGFSLLATVQVLILLAFSLADIRVPALGPLPEWRIGLGVTNAGSPLLLFVLVWLLALGSVNLGILLSTFARTELQILQFIPLVIVPQGLLGGMIWPIEALPEPLEWLSRIMPMRYGTEGLRAVMVRGAGLDDGVLIADLLILAGLALAFVVLAGRTVRREVV
jgi:ABC-2 type transport system permease protein